MGGSRFCCKGRRAGRTFREFVVGGSRSCCKGRRAYGPHYSFTRGYGALHSPFGFLIVGVGASVVIMVVSVVVVGIHGGGMVRTKRDVC